MFLHRSPRTSYPTLAPGSSFTSHSTCIASSLPRIVHSPSRPCIRFVQKASVAFPGAWFSLPSPIPIPDSHPIWFVRSCTCTIRCCITFPPPPAAAGRGRACCCCCPLRSLHSLFPGVPRSSVAYKLPSYVLSHADYQSCFSFLVSSDPKSSRLVSSRLGYPNRSGSFPLSTPSTYASSRLYTQALSVSPVRLATPSSTQHTTHNTFRIPSVLPVSSSSTFPTSYPFRQPD